MHSTTFEPEIFLLQQFFSLEWLKQFAFSSIKFFMIVAKKKRENKRNKNLRLFVIQSETKSNPSLVHVIGSVDCL